MNVGGKYAVGSVATAISETVGVQEFVNPGWWGVAAGGSSTIINVLFADGTGTSLHNSTLTNFIPTLDVLDFFYRRLG